MLFLRNNKPYSFLLKYLNQKEIISNLSKDKNIGKHISFTILNVF